MTYEQAAKKKWNKKADRYNQWTELGQDEKDELIEKEKAAKGCRTNGQE